ncbi:MAG: hypothetical protein IIW01_04435, partial [Thermoguttaceae bacterium]|nr:hypothetical protein [Thermoguttaceae bacterium]
MRFTQSNSRRRFATLASALALGAAVSFADFSVFPSAVAAENSTQSAQTAEKPGYAIIASPQVLDDADWAKVVESLKAKRSEEFNVSVI